MSTFKPLRFKLHRRERACNPQRLVAMMLNPSKALTQSCGTMTAGGSKKDDFDTTVEIQLEALRSILIAAHHNEVRVLKDEVSGLRAELSRSKEKSLTRETTVETPFTSPEQPQWKLQGDGVHFVVPTSQDNKQARSRLVGDLDTLLEKSRAPQGVSRLNEELDLPAGKPIILEDVDVEPLEDANKEPSEKLKKEVLDEPVNEKKVSPPEDLGKNSSENRAQNTSLADRTHRLYDDTHHTQRALGVSSVESRKATSFRNNVEKPDRLQRFVFSNTFEVVSGLFILGNSIIIALQLQYNGFDVGYGISVAGMTSPARDVWPGAEKAFELCNYGFNAAFACELLLRLIAQRLGALLSGWIWFDMLVVSFGWMDVLASDALAFNPGMMRLVRVVRLARLLKVFQSLKAVDSLFLLLKSLYASRVALFWSFLLLFVVQTVVGLLVCQLLQDYVSGGSLDAESKEEIFKYFGTFSKTMLTMFEITLANWVPSCRAMVKHVHESVMLFYIVYRCIFCFAILKVVAAVFITETNRVLESDDELALMKRNRDRLMFKDRIMTACNKIDEDNSGTLDWEELDHLCTDPGIAASVQTLGFQMHDIEKLFWLIDDGTGEISIQDFINKTGKLKGASRTIDMLTLLKLNHRIDVKLEKLLAYDKIDLSEYANDKVEEEEALAL